MSAINQDLEKSSVFFLKDILHLKRENKMLIYVDEASDDITTNALMFEANKMGVHVDIIRLQMFSNLTDMVKALVNKIENEDYDAVCELSEQYFYPTIVWKKARQRGCRVYALGAIDSASFIRCIKKTDYTKIYDFGVLLYKILKKSRNVQIYTESGTDITFKMTSTGLIDKILAKSKLMQRAAVWRPYGVLKPRGSSTFMVGQVAFLGTPATIEGTVVVDGYQWPPDEIGIVDEPIVLRVKKGHVVSVEGSPSKSTILSRWLEGKDKEIKHFCIGFHPGARLEGRIVEAERTFGCIAIGIGTYPFHTDGIIKNPTLTLNDSVILQNGSFIHEQLSVLEKDLLSSERSDMGSLI